VALLVVVGASAACSSGSSSGADEPAHPAADAGDDGATGTTLDAGDAVLIPPSGATSPTSGPPITDPLAAAAPPAAATCAGRAASRDRVAEDLDLRVQLGATLETGRVRWGLTVTNRGDGAVTLVYPTSQDGDVVLRHDGAAAYRWSAGQSFAQGERCQVIGAAQQYRVELGGVPLDVEPGDYTLVASLAAAPTPAPARVEVTIVGPGAG
jgi:hypothetical protein